MEGGTAAAPMPPPGGRERAAESIRLLLGFFVIAILVLASLALINSFFLEPPAPQGPRVPQQRESGGNEGGGGGVQCDDVANVLLIVFFTLAVATAALFGLAIARRQHHANRIATSPWGIGATIGFFFSLISLGVWRLIDVLCTQNLTCGGVVDGSYTTFLLLLGLTLASFGFGIAFAFRTRRNFFLTGWGIIGIVLWVPTMLAAVFWYLMRVACTMNLSCSLRDQFLDTLATIFWAGLLGAVLAFGTGYYFQRRLKFNMFASGLGVLGICLLVLSGGAAYGYDYVRDLKIPFCDPIEEQEFNETVKDCVEIRDDVLGRLYMSLWFLIAVCVASLGIGVYFHRSNVKALLRSPWAIVAYVGLALIFVTFLMILLANSMCPGEGGDDIGDSGDGTPGDGNDGRSGRGGGFGGGGGGGGGGGVGGSGAAPGNIPIQLGTIPLMWVLIILGGLFAGALLLLLLKRRATLERLDAPPAPTSEVASKERTSLLQILQRGELTSKEAVVAAYRSFLAWSDQRGIGKLPQETPMEHAMRVRRKYSIADRPMRQFIHAYEVARLSHRDPTTEERRSAVNFSQEIESAMPDSRPKEEP